MNLNFRGAFRKAKKSLTLMRRPASRAALLNHGVAGAVEHDAVLRAASYDVIVDVGANRGQFSLAARHFHPQANIVAFEPLAPAAAVYRRIFQGDTRVRLYESAIGPVKTEAAMQISQSEDSSSLLPIGKLMPELYPGTGAAGIQTVAVAPMTEFLSAADMQARALLKIDVQGYELEVLRSAESLLPSFDAVYVEASFFPFYDGQALADEVIAHLQARQFQLRGMMNVSYHPWTGMALQADFFFIHRAKAR